MKIRLTECWSDYAPGTVLDLPDALGERLCSKEMAVRQLQPAAAQPIIETAEAPASESTTALQIERPKPSRRSRRNQE